MGRRIGRDAGEIGRRDRDLSASLGALGFAAARARVARLLDRDGRRFLQVTLHDLDEAIERDGLGEDRLRAERACALQLRLARAGVRQEEQREIVHRRRQRPHGLTERESVEAREADVEDREVDPAALDLLEPLLAVVGAHHAVARIEQSRFQSPALLPVGLDAKHGSCHLRCPLDRPAPRQVDHGFFNTLPVSTSEPHSNVTAVTPRGVQRRAASAAG